MFIIIIGYLFRQPSNFAARSYPSNTCCAFITLLMVISHLCIRKEQNIFSVVPKLLYKCVLSQVTFKISAGHAVLQHFGVPKVLS